MKLLPLLLLSFLLCNCASVGTKDLEDFGKYVGLKPGETTKVDIYSSFGQPADVVYDGEEGKSASSWVYIKADMDVNGWSYVPYIGMLAGGVSESNMMARFWFDDKSKFLKLKTDQDSNYTNQWVGLTRDTYRRAKDPKADLVQAEMQRLGKPYDKKFAKILRERRF